MTDLQNLYVRANVCVACHQVVSPALLEAGHPELIFELDGQSVAEPKHWSMEKNGNPAQAWFVGQAVALREMSWDLVRQTAPKQREINRLLGLLWVVQRTANQPQCPPPPAIATQPTAENFTAIHDWADRLAQTVAKSSWSNEFSDLALASLANSSNDYLQTIPAEIQARRAERLVLALDRLLAAENNHRADAELDQLFKLAQSVPDFDSKKFADALSRLSQILAQTDPTKAKRAG